MSMLSCVENDDPGSTVDVLKKLFRDTKTYIALLLGAMVIIVSIFVWGSLPVSGSQIARRVAVPQGASGKQIARLLHDKNIIRSPFVFRLTCMLSGSSGRLKPGVYEFRQSMPLPVIMRRLVNGETLESWITVPEGFTVRQIADTLGHKQLANPNEFLEIVLQGGYESSSHPFVYGESLEGYLFPDTYLVDRVAGVDDMVNKMLDTFEAKALGPRRERIEQVMSARFGLGPRSLPLGLHRILTLASLVEREAKVGRDRPLIAAVLWNRIKKGMRLEVDASVSYRPGESTRNKAKTYYRDLHSDSEYNTYKHDGLPPGPICNPGVAAIDAVLNPAQTDALYYVAKRDGSHVFSRTFDEHIKAKNARESGKL